MNWVKNANGGETGEFKGRVLMAYKIDRRLDPYMGVVVDVDGKNYNGLFSTQSKAKVWCREKAVELSRVIHAEIQ